MRYKIFGRRTGLRLSELPLGAGNFGTRWRHGAKRAEAKKVFDVYVEAGDTLAFSKPTGVRPMERAAEAYEHMMSGKARFRAVLASYASLT